MNILPFVSIFLVLLASLSYSLLDTSKTLVYEKEVALSHMKIERQLLRRLHREAFKKIPKKPQESPSSPAEDTPQHSPDISPRETALSTMNLFPLLQEQLAPDFEQIFARLLKILYGPSLSALQENLDTTLSHLTKSILQQGRKKLASYKEENKDPATLSLVDLYPQTPVEHTLFYKMLKGTHDYDCISEGYPPLEAFFCLNTDRAQKIFHFPSLSPLMLTAVFGEQAAQIIFEKEKALRTAYPERKLKTLSKAELISLLHQHFPTLTFYDVLVEYLEFTSRLEKKAMITACDQVTHVYIERPRL